MKSIEQIIQHLQLKPHPEGGFYRETYRSAEEIKQDSLGSEFKGKRNFSTCIYLGHIKNLGRRYIFGRKNFPWKLPY